VHLVQQPLGVQGQAVGLAVGEEPRPPRGGDRGGGGLQRLVEQLGEDAEAGDVTLDLAAEHGRRR
jgi:hypothetical protein